MYLSDAVCGKVAGKSKQQLSSLIRFSIPCNRTKLAPEDENMEVMTPLQCLCYSRGAWSSKSSCLTPLESNRCQVFFRKNVLFRIQVLEPTLEIVLCVSGFEAHLHCVARLTALFKTPSSFPDFLSKFSFDVFPNFWGKNPQDLIQGCSIRWIILLWHKFATNDGKERRYTLLQLQPVGTWCWLKWGWLSMLHHPSMLVLVDRLVQVQPFNNIGIWKHIPRPFLQSLFPSRKNTVVRQGRIFFEIHCQLFWIHQGPPNFCLLEAHNDPLPWRYQTALRKTDHDWECCEAKRSNLIPVAKRKEKPKQSLRPVFKPGDEKPCGAEEINCLVAHLQIDLFNHILGANVNGLVGLASNWPGQNGQIGSAHLPSDVLVRGYATVRCTNDVKGEYEQRTAVHQDLAQEVREVRRLIPVAGPHGIHHSAQQKKSTILLETTHPIRLP